MFSSMFLEVAVKNWHNPFLLQNAFSYWVSCSPYCVTCLHHYVTGSQAEHLVKCSTSLKLRCVVFCAVQWWNWWLKILAHDTLVYDMSVKLSGKRLHDEFLTIGLEIKFTYLWHLQYINVAGLPKIVCLKRSMDVFLFQQCSGWRISDL